MASSLAQARQGLGFVRFGAGLVLLSAGWTALRTGLPDGDALTALLQGAEAKSFPFGAWAESVLAENPPALALLWRVLLLASGLLLTLGALTRPAAAIAALLVVHAWAYGPAESHALHFLLLVILAVSAWTRAGRSMGLDSALDRMLPRSVTWTPRSKKDLF